MDGGCLCCVDGQEGEVAVCQSPALFRCFSRRQLKCRAETSSACCLLIVEFWSRHWNSVNYRRSDFTSPYGPYWLQQRGRELTLFFCVSEGGFILTSRRRHMDTWLHWHMSRYCWRFKCLIKWGPVAWRPGDSREWTGPSREIDRAPTPRVFIHVRFSTDLTKNINTWIYHMEGASLEGRRWSKVQILLVPGEDFPSSSMNIDSSYL